MLISCVISYYLLINNQLVIILKGDIVTYLLNNGNKLYAQTNVIV